MTSHVAAFLLANVFDGADITASSETPTTANGQDYSAANVLSTRSDQVWRSQSGAAYIDFDCGRDVDITAMQIRVPSDRDPLVSPRSLLMPSDMVTLSGGNTPGPPWTNEISFRANHVPRRGYIPFVLTDTNGELMTWRHQYWRISFNAASEFIEVEEIVAGDLFIPAFNYNRRFRRAFDGESNIGTSTFSGVQIPQSRSRLLERRGSWDVWSESELETWRAFFEDFGTTRRFVLFERLFGDLKRATMSALFIDEPVEDELFGSFKRVLCNFRESK